MIDLTSADDIEIKITKHSDGYRFWLHVNGALVCRVYRVRHVSLDAPDHYPRNWFAEEDVS